MPTIKIHFYPEGSGYNAEASVWDGNRLTIYRQEGDTKEEAYQNIRYYLRKKGFKKITKQHVENWDDQSD